MGASMGSMGGGSMGSMRGGSMAGADASAVAGSTAASSSNHRSPIGGTAGGGATSTSDVGRPFFGLFVPFFPGAARAGGFLPGAV